MPPAAEPLTRARLCAFGVSIASELDLLGADGAVSSALPAVRLRRAHGADDRTRRGGGETVLERRAGDGSLGMRVRRLPDDAFAVDAPGYGDFLVSSAGDVVCVDVLQGPPEHWQRPLLGQVLPIAATLCGYETLHASAVVFGGDAVAISAPSGTGKSSLMMSLVDRGAGLLADDVVALEIGDDELIAHAGSPLAHLSRAQHAALSGETRAELGPPVTEHEKLTFAIGSLRRCRAPLRTLIELRRSERIGRLTVSPVPAPSPAQLFATTFLPHVTGPTRSMHQLQAFALLARSVSVLRLDAPASVPARDLAQALERVLSRSAEDRSLSADRRDAR